MTTAASTVMKEYPGQHIASFSEFFKISAFFIAYVLFYALTVPLFMIFINKSWKVVAGLVDKLLSKGYSVKVVSLNCFLTFLGKFPLTPMDPLGTYYPNLPPNIVGALSCVQPGIL